MSAALVASIAVGLAAPNAWPAITAPPTGPLQLEGARLGMALSDWKALSSPAEAGARAACAPAASTLVCGYAAPNEEVSLPLVKSYRMRRPRYYFVAGTLSKIEFHTSIDAFNDVMAMLEAKYGPASQTLRNSVDVGDNIYWPRVKKIWRLPGGTIELTDPASPASQIAVQFSRGPLTAP